MRHATWVLVLVACAAEPDGPGWPQGPELQLDLGVEELESSSSGEPTELPSTAGPCVEGCAMCWRGVCAPACETDADCADVGALGTCAAGACWYDCRLAAEVCPEEAPVCWLEGPAGFPACGGG